MPEDSFYKISFICHEYPPIGGGAATVLETVSEKLAHAGHSIQVLTIGSKNQQPYKKVPRRDVIALSDCRRHAFCPTYLELLKSYWALKYKAPSYLDAFNPDIIISFFAFPAGRAILPYVKSKQIPHIVSIRGADAPRFHEHQFCVDRLIIPCLTRRVVKESQGVYANGPRLKKLVEDAFQGVTVENIPNGVAFPDYQRKSIASSDPLKIIFVGQLISRKRIEESLKGIQWLATHSNKSIEFTIVGSGFLEESLKTQATQSPQNLKVSFKGYLNRDTIQDLYKDQHIMIHLSRYEGLSNTLLEGFSHGLGILASRDIVNELDLIEKFPGIILSDFSPSSIGKALGEMSNNTSTLNKISHQALDYAKIFSWDHHIQRLLQMVERII